MDHMNLITYKMINSTLNPLSAHNNNNSPHKFGFKFYMRAGDQKLKYNLEWPKRASKRVV